MSLTICSIFFVIFVIFKEALIKLVCAMAERFLRIARKWLKDAAVLLQYADIQRFSGVTVANALAETVTKPFTKTPGKRADKLISSS